MSQIEEILDQVLIEAIDSLKKADEGPGGNPWSIEPVGILDFFRYFLRRTLLSEAQRELLLAICGEDPASFDTRYDRIIAGVGQRGGKNFCVEGVACYYAYKLGCLSDPHGYFGISRDREIAITNSSCVNETQAKEVFFRNLQKTMRSTIDPDTGRNWFEEHLGMDIRPGGFGDIKKKAIRMPYGATFYSFDSTPEAPEGQQILLSIIDEASRKNTPTEYAQAKKLYNVVYGNVLASFPDHGKVIVFSYLEQRTNDLTYELLQKGKTNPKIYAINVPTWVFNPTITREMLQEKFDEDPVDAACRYGGVVPTAKFSFFNPYVGKIRECVNPHLENRALSAPTVTRRIVRDQGEQVEKEYSALEMLQIRGDERPRVFAGDPALSGDGFIISGGYAEDLPEPISIKFAEDEELEIGKRIVVDVLLKCQPDKQHTVEYLDLEQKCIALLKEFPNTRAFYFDRYNSESLRQVIEQRGVLCEARTLSNPEQLKLYKILRTLVWNNQADFLGDEEGIRELEEVLLINKRKIDHPEGGSKDISDTYAMIAGGLMMIDSTLGPELDVGESFDRMCEKFRELQKEYTDRREAPDYEEIARRLGLPSVEEVYYLKDYVDQELLINTISSPEELEGGEILHI